MAVDFEKSRTKENLMKAFAGESQARNRYTFAQSICIKQQLYVLADLFKFTADQEKAHAWIFYSRLSQCAGENVTVEGTYPVDAGGKPEDLLKAAAHNEFQEAEKVYPEFAAVAREEGFPEIAGEFENIARIEKIHGDRFNTFHSLMQNGKLFSSDKPEVWVCLNCGYILESSQVPEKCPVCSHPQGYYIRLSMASWGCGQGQ